MSPRSRTPSKPAARRRSRIDTSTNGQLSARAEAQLMTSFLEEVERDALYGTKVHVTLGALKGFPMSTDDPAIVEEAIKVVNAKAEAATTRIVELQHRQRVITLRDALERLNAPRTGPSAARVWFLAHGKEWCDKQRFPYGWQVLHEMGVPKATLAEAGFKVPGVRRKKE